MATADLFDTPLLPGLSYRDGFIGAAEQRTLITRIDDAELNPFRFQKWTGKRVKHSSVGAKISRWVTSRRPSQPVIG